MSRTPSLLPFATIVVAVAVIALPVSPSSAAEKPEPSAAPAALGAESAPEQADAPDAQTAEPVISQMEAGQSVTIGERQVSVKEVDIVPLVDSKYSRRFTFDSYENPKLSLLRKQEKLDEVVAEGKDEFDRQVLLLDWAYRRFKKFGRPSSQARGALDILEAIDQGHTFYCSHYADVLVSASASMGWINRPLALRLGNHLTAPGGGSTEHAITEIWSNQHRKWIMFDPTYAMYVEKDGTPLSAWEIRREWFADEGKSLTFVLGAERKKVTRKDMPLVLAVHPGFGELALGTRTMDKYAFLGYIPNNNLMDAGLDYAKMFIVRDKLTEGVAWHKRDNPEDPAVDPYFPMQQAALTVTPATSISKASGGEGPGEAGAEALTMQVKAETLTPNFLTWRYRLDGGEWVDGELNQWALRPGTNSLEMRAVNRFGVAGPASRIVLEVK